MDPLGNAMEISASALKAERKRMNAIAQNIANANSTRTPEGGVYQRKDVVFAASPLTMKGGNETFDSILAGRSKSPEGVEATETTTQFPPLKRYEPSHPEADSAGYVSYPNINVVEEIADLTIATRAYEANITASKATMDMEMKVLQFLGK